MLSTDELVEGTTFILTLPDADGNAVFWMEKLKGEVARHWYTIYLTSDGSVCRGGRRFPYADAVGRRRTYPKIGAMRRHSTPYDEFDGPRTPGRLNGAGARFQFLRAGRLTPAINSLGSTSLAG